MVTVENLLVEYPLEDGGLHAAVRGVSLTVERGEFFTLLGPSGCGKTSMLRGIAGLERPTRGCIRIGEVTVFDGERQVDVPGNRRDVSMVFQSYAIWPHLTVAQNVAFPLEVGRVAKAERVRRVNEVLELVGLSAMASRPATKLSGGQQQRVAIARGIVRGSSLVLLDEPLSNLDAKLREQMRAELRQLLKRVGVTALYVTHDQEEALTLSDRIAVMDGGAVIETGTPSELYLNPATKFAATFLGQTELFAVKSAAGDVFDTDVGPLRVHAQRRRASAPTHLIIRPEAIRVSREAGDAANTLRGDVVDVRFSGRYVTYRVKLAQGRELMVLAPPFDVLPVGTAVAVDLPPERLVAVAATADS
ncbi:MAG: ABC transporter ATP-binding protein [Burkholderiales bacterium]|nr:ABC transporter ATP-binding protein [Burkholderiales bacterium]